MYCHNDVLVKFPTKMPMKILLFKLPTWKTVPFHYHRRHPNAIEYPVKTSLNYSICSSKGRRLQREGTCNRCELVTIACWELPVHVKELPDPIANSWHRGNLAGLPVSELS